MTRTRGRAPKGAHGIAAAPQGHWKTTTFIAGLRVRDLTASMVLDGSMDGAAFLVYVRECVCPTLTRGDSVIADNLASHTVAGVRAAIEAAGATRRDLPPYSPDLTPIEKLFSTLNALLSKAAHRTVDARWTEIGNLLPTFSPDECQHYFASSGYGHTSIENALAPLPYQINTYRLHARFVRMTTQNQELLIRHILGFQRSHLENHYSA